MQIIQSFVFASVLASQSAALAGSLIPIEVKQPDDEMRIGLEKAAAEYSAMCLPLKHARLELTEDYKLRLKMKHVASDPVGVMFAMSKGAQSTNEDSRVVCKLYVTLLVSPKTSLTLTKVTPRGWAYLTEGHSAALKVNFGYIIGASDEEHDLSRAAATLQADPADKIQKISAGLGLSVKGVEFDFDDTGRITLALEVSAELAGAAKDPEARSYLTIMGFDAQLEYSDIIDRKAGSKCSFADVKVALADQPFGGDCMRAGVQPKLVVNPTTTGTGSKQVVSVVWNDQFVLKSDLSGENPLTASCQLKLAISYPEGCTLPLQLIHMDGFTSNERDIYSKVRLKISGSDPEAKPVRLVTGWYGMGRREIRAFSQLGKGDNQAFWTSCKTGRDVLTFDFSLQFKQDGRVLESDQNSKVRQNFVSLDTFSFVLLNQSDPASKKWRIKNCS